jgi:exodeoxyribonuclease-5
MIWSPQQDAALKAVDKWFYQESKKKQVFRVFGYAGTGKSTLARHFAETIDGDVLYAAFTGKAALVMQKNGCVGARTIHSLIYIPEVDKKTGEVNFILNRAASVLNDATLLVIDECSMVDEHMARDLLSFNKPILVLGDPAQLPPVSGAGYFTEAKPDVMLTEIHRQAKDNPIIYLATQVRNGEYPDLGAYGDSRVVAKISSQDALNADQILVGRNVTRDDLNIKMRKLLKLDPDQPVKGDRLICLKNDQKLGIYNGGMFTVNDIRTNRKKETFFDIMAASDDDRNGRLVVASVHKSFLMKEVPKPAWKHIKNSQEFDYSYAITCHKSQGSQWDNVLIYDESWCFREVWQRWLYTAITRASETVTILKN